MLESIKKEWQSKVALALFVFLSVWWFTIFFSSTKNIDYNQLFAAVYGIMALWGSIWGFVISAKWGGYKSVFGRAILMFGTGLLLQEFGQVAYSYYIYFLHVDVPYPSIGDIGYFGSIIFYVLGVYNLSKIANVKVVLGDMKNKILVILIPLLMLALPYFLFLKTYTLELSNPIKTFLDFGYPIGEAFYVSLTLITLSLSRKILGGMLKPVIISFLIALVLQYAADFMFLFQSNNGTWYAGGANDYMYLVAYFFLTMAILQLKTALSKLRS